MGPWGRGVLVVGALVLIAACEGSDDRVTPATSKPAQLVGVGRPHCAPASPFDADAGNEVRGTTASGEVWGIAMGTRVPPAVGQPLKIVWRVTGRGPLRVRVRGPGGRTVPLAFGPDPHGGSTYHRPGDEWGTGFVFPQRGCWNIHLARIDTRGDVWIRVT